MLAPSSITEKFTLGRKDLCEGNVCTHDIRYSFPVDMN